MNIDLLLKVKARILAAPSQFVMNISYANPHTIRDQRSLFGKAPSDDIDRDTIENCGTAACIAGWAVAITRDANPKSMWDQYDDLWDPVQSIAAAELGLEPRQCGNLFHISGWPRKFRERWYDATTLEHRALIAADRIDHFIATGGEDY